MNTQNQPARNEARETLDRLNALPPARRSPEDHALILFLKIKTGSAYTI